MALSRKLRKKINALTEMVEKIRLKMLAEWNVSEDSMGGRVIGEYCQVDLNALIWQVQRDAGEKVNTTDLANFQKIKTELVKRMAILKKIAPTPAEVEEAEAEAKLKSEVEKTGEDLKSESEFFDVHKLMKRMEQADWDFIVAAEAGKHGEAGLKWAVNVRKSHQIIWKLGRAIEASKPTQANKLAMELRAKKGLPGESFDIDSADLPKD